jgi:uncharacterized membrane protein
VELTGASTGPAAVSPARRSVGWLPWTALALCVLGLADSGYQVYTHYLIYRELISLGRICPYCTSVHIITFLLFGLLVYDATGSAHTALTAR